MKSALLCTALIVVAASDASAQDADSLVRIPGTPAAVTRRPLPFAPGEELVYTAKIGVLGLGGTATSRVNASSSLRDAPAILLQFDYRGKFLFLVAENHTKSWISAEAFTALRFEKREKSPFSSVHEEFDFNAAEKRWTGLKGDSGTLISAEPLDDLSVLYFLRTLALGDTATQIIDRHFISGQNPLMVRMLRREKVEVPAGSFDAIVVELRMPNRPDTTEVQTTIVHLSDDALRTPVRVQKSVKGAGTMVLSLKCVAGPAHTANGKYSICKK